MRYLHCFVTLLWVACVVAVAAPVRAEAVRTDHASASLLGEVTAIHPGQSFWVAVRLELDEGWHVYWKNPGDSGLPPEITWKLPGGFSAGDIRWQPPEIIRIGELVNYGYEGDVWLLVPVTPPGYITRGHTFILTAEVSWLVCRDVCIPESATLSLPFGVTETGEVLPSEWAESFSAYKARLPRPLPEQGVFDERDGHLLISGEVPGISNWAIERVEFFPDPQGIIDHQAQPQEYRAGDRLHISVARGAVPLPEKVEGIVSFYLAEGEGTKQRRDFSIALEHGVVTAFAGDHSSQTMATPAGAGQPLEGVWQALLFALLGGVILNAMPCVFPVLSLKALSVAKKASHAPASVRWQGIAYTAGVLLCFAILSAVLILLKQGGAQVGWGFQLQSPIFVTAMAYLFFLVGLSLSGVFYLPVLFGGAAGKLTGKEGAAGSFFTGMLAALVATPCTVPFMAPAVGYALSQPQEVAVAVFLTLGLGLALPYLLISMFPPLLRLLPKPGAWMETFKQFLAFPMYATAAWLLWVLSRQAGSDGLALALSGIVILALFAWLFAREQPRVRLVRGGLLLILALLTAGTLYMQVPDAGDGSVSGNDAVKKEPFSQQRLEELRAQGKAVFVNATADWCITCKANERLALRSDMLWQEFEKRGIIYLEADWTLRDAAIAGYLRSFGRSGVPLYVYYPPNGGEAVVLPQLLLGASTVLEAIDGSAQ